MNDLVFTKHSDFSSLRLFVEGNDDSNDEEPPVVLVRLNPEMPFTPLKMSDSELSEIESTVTDLINAVPETVSFILDFKDPVYVCQHYRMSKCLLASPIKHLDIW